ncbi:nitrogen permease regulator of amino acid transport activity 3-domain-containing protein [Suillus cothurnatus]|nr:nitrogen permease regulator of amino acid transport activity 3-domain-containing protein [Suillus cothurnatus]
MAETLLAILLVTSSAKGPNVVYRWPPSVVNTRPRLSRPRPPVDGLELDNPWRASHYSDNSNLLAETHVEGAVDVNIDDYAWRRPTESRDRSMSFSRSTIPASGRDSPCNDDRREFDPIANEYQCLFDYTAQFLAGMLCPQRHLCHQKFELVIDNLVFAGHPVCAEPDGVWRFKPDRYNPGSRGRGSRHRESNLPDKDNSEVSLGGDTCSTATPKSSWLHMFHLVLVFDLPDPSSSASGNIARYFDTIYEQIAFTVTAVLFQEQVLSNFVELECDAIGSLETEYMVKGERFSDFVSHAQRVSSIATAMKNLYDAIKSSNMAHITLNDLPLELQLPPYLDHLLHSEEEFELEFMGRLENQTDSQLWGRELSFGWRLPALVPWKSLLLLDADQELDPYVNLRGSHVHAEERSLAEGLIKFLETVSVTLSLADMASLLDWDLHSQVYPTVRWLVHHRRAKIVDTVHNGLKTIFSIAPKFDKPLAALAAEFKRDFPQPPISPLPTLMATISNSNSKQADNHFFATVVQSKDLISLYHEVVLWMLKRDLLITLHLHVRVVTTAELKVCVRQAHERKLERRASHYLRGRRRSSRRGDHGVGDALEHPRINMPWLSLSPKVARQYPRRSMDSGQSKPSDISGSILLEDAEDVFDEISEEDSGEENVGWGSSEDTLEPSIISDPGTASPLERKWLAAMSEGKDEYIARRFALINQYFDGKRTDDEILYTAEISRKQLREVLHHYEEYLQTFLHPA